MNLKNNFLKQPDLAKANNSYKQIIRSTGIFGGSQLATVILGIIRNKILAVLLGAAGIGLMSIYQNILDLVKSISSFGIETGGIREIASKNTEAEKEELIYTISLIDKMSFFLASLGGAICIVLSYPVSIWAFGSTSHVWKIGALSFCVFFSILAAGQTVVLHGLRRIADMVRATVIGATASLLLTLPLYYFLRAEGIIPSFILAAIITYISAYYYKRKINIPKIKVTLSEVFSKGKPVLRIGFFIVISSILTTIGYFTIRTFISNHSGLYAVGLYQAVWSVTGVSLMLILKSMGADFYPRLCTIIEDKKSSVQLINEQTYVVLIVSLPVIVLLLLCSKSVLSLLYTSEFTEAHSMMNWQILGTFFKVLSWPLGFILLAKGKGLIYFFSEMFFLAVYLLLSFWLYEYFQLDAVGIAYLTAYVAYLFIVLVWGIKLCRFSWSGDNLFIGFISFILVLLAFHIVQYNDEYTIIAGIPVFLASVLFSFFKLNKIYPLRSIWGIFKKE